MLNKELCKRCYKDVMGGIYFENTVKEAEKRKEVWCVHDEKKGYPYWISINSKPPKDCPFLLEQTVWEC